MRILVLEENEGQAHFRECREVFEVADLRIGYACPGCKTAFTFGPDQPAEKWRKCPMCGVELAVREPNASNSEPLLSEAIALYREFCAFVTKRKLSVTLVAINRDAGTAGR